MTEIEIREEVASDRTRIRAVERLAFDSSLQADLVDTLRASGETVISLVAQVDDRIVGHIFFSPVSFETNAATTGAQLSPVAVAPDHQRQGIGAKLIRAGLDRCPDRGWLSVFLVGNPAYYTRFGFQMAKPLGFSCAGPHDPFLQVLELAPGALAGTSGLVRFHPAFDEAEER